MEQMRGLWCGKRLDNNEWIVGYLMRTQSIIGMTVSYIMQAEKSTYIFNDDYIAVGDEWIPVETETIGEYTGLRDKNKKPVFEGNRIRFETISGSRERTGVIFWCAGMFYVDGQTSGGKEFICRLDYIVPESIEIIGNFHDDFQLLKGDENNGAD